MTQAKYRWTITTDHIENGLHDDLGGPHNYNASIESNPASFALYDDDNILYYEGTLFGDYTGFEPLDDFGMPNAGCTRMKLNGEWL